MRYYVYSLDLGYLPGNPIWETFSVEDAVAIAKDLGQTRNAKVYVVDTRTSQEIYLYKGREDMPKILFVGGNFGENIRPSGYIQKMYEHMVNKKKIQDITFQNGGSFTDLEHHLKTLNHYDIIFWFANVPNTFEKLVNDIKVKAPRAILVTSKNNLEGKYNYHMMVARLLKVKANLCLVFTKEKTNIQGTLIDPLLNAFTLKEESYTKVADALISRAFALKNYTRAASHPVGDPVEVPDQPEFFKIAHDVAETFHTLIHAENTERYLGNLSFRCEKGFPSFRDNDVVFVSKRNIDKREIDKNGFVGVSIVPNFDGSINYLGDIKPSVDTPVQVALYNKYPKIKYMMHSHVYIDAPFTTEKIPCGALEEIESIWNMFPSDKFTMIKVNLRGHGSLIMTNTLETFNNIKYKGRPFPEYK